MKAWHVNDEKSYEGGSAIVFAETRGKAHQLALRTDACEDAEWNDVRVLRAPAFDKYYTEGKWEMDWYTKADRIAMVQNGWSCLEPEWDDCKFCEASEWCGPYQDYIREEARNGS